MGEPEKGVDVADRGSDASPSDVGLLSEEEKKRLLRKTDLHVLPMLFIVYLAAFLDRANVSNALTMKMPQDLHLTGQQPNIALAVFFVPYILFEVPSNFLMKRLSPRVWLAACTFGFGIIMLGQGFVKSFSGLVATRFFLGLCEAGIFPGSFYLISFWYQQEESQKRFTYYFCSVLMASAFGGLFATGIANMNGTGGLANWRWLFVLEGLLTLVVSVAAYFFISDFPEQAKWLTEAERAHVLAQNEKGRMAEEPLSSKDFAYFFRDFKNWLGAFMYFSAVTPIYAFAYFTPTIVKTLGYSVVQTQLHSVPPFAAAFGLCIVNAVLSDRLRRRFPFVIFGNLLLIIGLAILMTIHKGFPIRYLGICLVCMGAYSTAISVVCWYVMNLQGHKQRAIGTAWIISFGNMGGILAPFAFLTKFAPYYRTGYAIVMSVAVVGSCSALAYASLVLIKKRKSARSGVTTGKLSL